MRYPITFPNWEYAADSFPCITLVRRNSVAIHDIIRGFVNERYSFGFVSRSIMDEHFVRPCLFPSILFVPSPVAPVPTMQAFPLSLSMSG